MKFYITDENSSPFGICVKLQYKSHIPGGESFIHNMHEKPAEIFQCSQSFTKSARSN